MRQKAYRKLDDLITGTTQLSAGAANHAVSLGLVTLTKPIIDSEINAFNGAVDSLQQGRHDLRAMRTTLKTKISEGTKIAYAVRDSLKRTFGMTYNPLWEGTPFNGSLKVPRSAGRLEQTLRLLKTFLTDNPSHELAGVATALIAGDAANALGVARVAVQNQKSAVRGMRTAREQKEKLLRRRIRLSVEELKSVLGPIDARWEAFGLNQPGIAQKPEEPGKVTAVQNGTSASLEWDPTARADYYRVWVKVIGVDAEASAVGTPSDPDFALDNLPPGKQVEVSVSAVNNGGESLRSEPTVITVP